MHCPARLEPLRRLEAQSGLVSRVLSSLLRALIHRRAPPRAVMVRYKYEGTAKGAATIRSAALMIR